MVGKPEVSHKRFEEVGRERLHCMQNAFLMLVNPAAGATSLAPHQLIVYFRREKSGSAGLRPSASTCCIRRESGYA
jgi:hypothetical protein